MRLGIYQCIAAGRSPEEFAAVEESGRFPIPGLSGHAHVVRTEHDIPHIYAENRGAFLGLERVLHASLRFELDSLKLRWSQFQGSSRRAGAGE